MGAGGRQLDRKTNSMMLKLVGDPWVFIIFLTYISKSLFKGKERGST